jgi:hypothetical protein
MNALKLLWLFGFSLAVTKPKNWHVSEGGFRSKQSNGESPVTCNVVKMTPGDNDPRYL